KTWLVDGLTFQGFRSAAQTGGVIRTDGGAFWTLTVQNCTFDDNDNTFWGGAIGTENGNRWTLNIDNCTFTDNRVTTGRDGGAIFLKSTATTQTRGIANITNCSFTSNFAGDDGGAIFNLQATLNMSDCTFTTNDVANGGQGGAYYTEGDRVISGANPDNRDDLQDCTFTSNTATRGGAVRLGSRNFGDYTRCIFTGNQTNQGDAGGGAVNYQNQEATNLVTDVVFTDCTFAGNSATIAGTNSAGGAVQMKAGGMTFRGCTFSSNTCPLEEGGAIALGANGAFDLGHLLVDDCRFVSNSAEQGGGLIVYSGGAEAEVRDSEFSSNSATLNGSDIHGGGAIFLGHSLTAPAFLTVDGCTFTGNTSRRSGGACLMKSGGYQISNSTFSANQAGHTTRDFTGGGAFRMEGDNSAAIFDGWREIEDCTFTGNLARSLTITRKSVAAPDGGAFYINLHQANIRRCTFTDNEADQVGGAIVLYNNVANALTLEDCSFTGNRAEVGAGVYTRGVTIVSGSTFANNSTWDDAEADVPGGSNFGQAGGLFANNDLSDVTISNSTFTGNYANDRGGALTQTNLGSLKVYNSTIVGNSVGRTNRGGGYGADSTSAVTARVVEFHSCIIADNTDSNGGNDEDIEGNLDVFENNLIRDRDGFWIGGVSTTGGVLPPSNVHSASPGTDPLLGALQNNGGLTSTMEPSQVSPVIDAGSNVLALTRDQRGAVFPRAIDHAATAPAAATADIGAVELASDDILDFTVTASPNITLRLSNSGNSYEIVSDATGTVIASQTVASTNSLDINGDGVANTLTVDFSNGDPLTAAGGSAWDGGVDAINDGVIVTGGSHTHVTYDALGVSNGTIDYDGSVLTYNGLEPITDNGSASTRTFTVSIAGDQTITVSSPSAGNTTVAGPAFENVTFANPTSSLTINTGDGDDTLNTDSATAANLFGLTVNLNAQDLTDDTINFDAQNGWAADSNPTGDTGSISGHLFALDYSSFSTVTVNNVDATLVPTLTQWGIFILFLLIGSVGMIQIARMNGAATSGSVPLDLSILRLWAGRCAIALLAFWTGCILLLGHLPLSDLIGGAICLPILAYTLHLVQLLSPQLSSQRR
ncbi:MAG: hypothetical protein ACI8W8_003024, partial [Rhodothermales bacterium]